jgi:hypothetical protein
MNTSTHADALAALRGCRQGIVAARAEAELAVLAGLSGARLGGVRDYTVSTTHCYNDGSSEVVNAWFGQRPTGEVLLILTGMDAIKVDEPKRFATVLNPDWIHRFYERTQR